MAKSSAIQRKYGKVYPLVWANAHYDVTKLKIYIMMKGVFSGLKQFLSNPLFHLKIPFHSQDI